MKLAYAILYAEDVERAAAFYKDLLDLPITDLTRKFATISVDNCLIGIKRTSEVREIPGSQTIILEVTDIERLYEKMASSGVTVVTPLNTADWGANFAILDPDRNKIEFVKAM